MFKRRKNKPKEYLISEESYKLLVETKEKLIAEDLAKQSELAEERRKKAIAQIKKLKVVDGLVDMSVVFPKEPSMININKVSAITNTNEYYGVVVHTGSQSHRYIIRDPKENSALYDQLSKLWKKHRKPTE